MASLLDIFQKKPQKKEVTTNPELTKSIPKATSAKRQRKQKQDAFAGQMAMTWALQAGAGDRHGAAIARSSTTLGIHVVPVRMEEAAGSADALRRLSNTSFRVEPVLAGKRLQVHMSNRVAQQKVFNIHGEHQSELSECVWKALRSGLPGDGDGLEFIVEALLMRAKKNLKQAGGEQEGSTLEMRQPSVSEGVPIVQDLKQTPKKRLLQELNTPVKALQQQMAPDETGGPSHGILVLCDLLFWSGEALVDQPLKSRLDRLRANFRESSQLRIIEGTEFQASVTKPEDLDAALDRTLRAYYVSPASEKFMLHANGLILKQLGEPWNGSVPPWLVLQNVEITGEPAEKLLCGVLSSEELQKLPTTDEFLFCVISARRTRTEEGRKDILNVQAQLKSGGVEPRWYVDADSLQDYRALGLEAVVGGKLIPARNMALEDAAREGKVCVQVSDDIGSWTFHHGFDQKCSSFDEANAAQKCARRCQISAVMCAQVLLAKMRAHSPRPKLGGVYPLNNMGQGFQLSIWSTTHFILGDFFVVDLESTSRFDTNLTLKEDYDFTCSHLREHGVVLRCNRITISAKHETNAGGACSIRDSKGEEERKNIRILQEKWPNVFRMNWKRPDQVIMRWVTRRETIEGMCGDEHDGDST